MSTQTTVQAEGIASVVTDVQQMDWIFRDIWQTAYRTSMGNAPPTTQLSAGGYVVYKLVTPSLRMASFIQKDPADYGKIFEVVEKPV